MATFHSKTEWLKQLDEASGETCLKSGRPIMLGASGESEFAIAINPPCKCWDCPPCAARNAKRWIARIIHGCNTMDTVNGWQMFTLTAHRKWRGKSSIKNLRQGWKKLYNRIRRKYGVQHYAKVWEMHADGETYHLHGLIDSQMSQSWLKTNAVQCGMGYQVEIHPVDNAGQVAGYIAKYFLKSEGVQKDGHVWEKNLRRIEVSRSWIKRELQENDMSWRIADSDNFADWWLSVKKSSGYEVRDLRELKITAKSQVLNDI